MNTAILYLACLTALLNGKKGHKTERGYLIYFEYSWFFQPCDEPGKGIFKSLSTGSFGIITGTDGYNNEIALMGDSLSSFNVINPVFYKDLRDPKIKDMELVGDLKYIYCILDYENESAIDSDRYFDPCQYEITQSVQKYYLRCYYCHPRVESIKRLYEWK